ncbi:MAG: hypothetical protein AAGF30_00265 [Pseudomonadota bacterium]
MIVALLTLNQRCGSLGDQRRAMAAEGYAPEREYVGPEEIEECIIRGTRDGDVLVLSDARALDGKDRDSRTKKRKREIWLHDLAERGVKVAIPGLEPRFYDEPEAFAIFHAEARKPTGRPSAKQKRMPGRPPIYKALDEAGEAQFRTWWSMVNKLTVPDIAGLLAPLLGKKPSRSQVYALAEKLGLPDRGKRPDMQKKEDQS